MKTFYDYASYFFQNRLNLETSLYQVGPANELFEKSCTLKGQYYPISILNVCSLVLSNLLVPTFDWSSTSHSVVIPQFRTNFNFAHIKPSLTLKLSLTKKIIDKISLWFKALKSKAMTIIRWRKFLDWLLPTRTSTFLFALLQTIDKHPSELHELDYKLIIRRPCSMLRSESIIIIIHISIILVL